MGRQRDGMSEGRTEGQAERHTDRLTNRHKDMSRCRWSGRGLVRYRAFAPDAVGGT